VSARLGAKCAQAALAWVRAKGCVPIASATRLEQLEELAQSVEVSLDPAALASLDAASIIGPGEEPVRSPPPRPQTSARSLQ
jgi:aryl-alcohol dehydrogenase-like predicted oxidoreductase